VATKQTVEVGADLVALLSLQVVALLASGLEKVGALLSVACEGVGSAHIFGFAVARSQRHASGLR